MLLLATATGVALADESGVNGSPSLLVVLLLALSLAGQWLSVEISGGGLSASLVAIILAMACRRPLRRSGLRCRRDGPDVGGQAPRPSAVAQQPCASTPRRRFLGA